MESDSSLSVPADFASWEEQDRKSYLEELRELMRIAEEQHAQRKNSVGPSLSAWHLGSSDLRYN